MHEHPTAWKLTSYLKGAYEHIRSDPDMEPQRRPAEGAPVPAVVRVDDRGLAALLTDKRRSDCVGRRGCAWCRGRSDAGNMEESLYSPGYVDTEAG